MSQLVFVYGTLKRGCPLHSWVEDQKCEGVGELHNHTLISFGAYPALLSLPKCPASVVGEVYRLDDKRFKQLKEMEEAVGYTVKEVDVAMVHEENSSAKCLTFLFYDVPAAAVSWKQPAPPKGTKGRASSFPGHVAIV